MTLKYLRYALATVCFAASVGCLALWWRSFDLRDIVLGSNAGQPRTFIIMVESGNVALLTRETPRPQASATPTQLTWRWLSTPLKEVQIVPHLQLGSFDLSRTGVVFPLWYASLVFALAGIAVLRFHRQFSIHSLLISVSVVALLLGMAVAL